MANRSPLAVIKQDLLDDAVPLTRVLRNVIMLAGDSGSTALRDWARLELHGYDEQPVPKYRKVRAQLNIDGQDGNLLFRGHNIGPEDLPEIVQQAGIGDEVRLGNPIAELEGIARRDEPFIKLAPPNPDMIRKFMNHGYATRDMPVQVHAVYWSVSRVSFEGVVDGARTALVELVAELERTLPADQQTPTKEQADQAVNFVNTGERATIIFNNSQASGSGTSTASLTRAADKAAESWFRRWRKRGILVGAFTVVGGVAGALQWLQIAPWS
ncbi:MAG: hypothetical protein AB7L91_17515 [Dehalococcoidia bacterium]